MDIIKLKCVCCGSKFSNVDYSKKSLLCAECNTVYNINEGIIDFYQAVDDDYKNKIQETINAFGYQWTNHETGHNEGLYKYTKQLFFDRYAIDEEEFAEYIKDKVVFDPAIGSGRMEYLYAKYAKKIYATDLSIAVYKAKEYLKDKFQNIQYYRGDLLNPPFVENSFDVVLCHAIIQHTGDTQRALKSFVKVLKEDGVLFVDFYKKATPIREFTDDFIRQKIQKLSSEEADEALKPLTKLAQEFNKYTVNVPDDIPYLDIKKGTYNLQRLIYYKFLKLFWNEHMSFDDNHNVMFDWFYPDIAQRYSTEEVKNFFNNIPELKIERFVVLEGGIGVIARKKSA